jgi:hypothetical protein
MDVVLQGLACKARECVCVRVCVCVCVCMQSAGEESARRSSRQAASHRRPLRRLSAGQTDLAGPSTAQARPPWTARPVQGRRTPSSWLAWLAPAPLARILSIRIANQTFRAVIVSTLTSAVRRYGSSS